MNSTILAPEQETFPNRYRWTVDECRRMVELGLLEGRYEVLDGEVVNKMGQKPPHYFGIAKLVQWLNSVFTDRYVRIQGPITLEGEDGVYSEPEPDIAVTREPSDAYAARHPLPGDIVLVVEVSDTTLKTDLLVKAKLYARASIPEFWVLDLTSRSLVIHRNPTGGEYVDVITHTQTESASPLDHEGDAVSVVDLLPPVET